MGVFFTFLTGLFLSFETITDNDYFWHVVIGRWIDINKSIPNRPLFSWWGMQSGLSWTSHEYLTEWIMYKLGDMGCIFMMLLIFLGLYYIMYKMIKVKPNKLLDIRWLYLLMMTVFFKVVSVRPYIISLLFFVYLIYVLFSYIDKEKKFDKLIWTIPIMQLLWVNLHGGSSSMPYVFLIAVLGCDFVVKLFKIKDSRFAWTSLDKKQVNTLIKVLLLSLIAGCINPTGYKILIYPFTNMADTNMIDLITEWQSPSFHGGLGLYIFIMVFIPVFNMILTKKKYKVHEVALFAMMFYMALKSQRFIGMFGIYSTWMVGKYIFIDDSFYEAIKKPFKKFEKIIYYGFRVLLVLIVIFIGYYKISTFTLFDIGSYYSDTAIEKIIELKPKRMYNDFGAGGYLLYKLSSYDVLDQDIFIYGLGDVFSNNILPDATNLYNAKPNTDELLEKYDFDVILTSSKSPLSNYIEKLDDWETYYSDDMCYIFIKKKS